jgi:hypothetical protein
MIICLHKCKLKKSSYEFIIKYKFIKLKYYTLINKYYEI